MPEINKDGHYFKCLVKTYGFERANKLIQPFTMNFQQIDVKTTPMKPKPQIRRPSKQMIPASSFINQILP